MRGLKMLSTSAACLALVEPPEPGPARRLMGPLQFFPLRPPADLWVFEGDAVPRDLPHLVLGPVLPHDVDVGVRRQLLRQLERVMNSSRSAGPLSGA